ncbi:MAG: hypothetical protein PHF67_01470 [Candidatus Nanoarchaeia archaeon]|nr:hypothetical protein [Candidatus Nanoarchaeia archaeon]
MTSSLFTGKGLQDYQKLVTEVWDYYGLRNLNPKSDGLVKIKSPLNLESPEYFEGYNNNYDGPRAIAFREFEGVALFKPAVLISDTSFFQQSNLHASRYLFSLLIPGFDQAIPVRVHGCDSDDRDFLLITKGYAFVVPIVRLEDRSKQEIRTFLSSAVGLERALHDHTLRLGLESELDKLNQLKESFAKPFSERIRRQQS